MLVTPLLAGLLSTLISVKPVQAWLDITAETSLDCGAGPNDLTAGYIDLESGSMFFTLFHAKEEARDKGLVIQFGGGPGATSWDYALLGAAPCQLKKGENGTLEPSPYSWTEHANVLFLDYPIGAGWSYNNADQIAPNTSEIAAYDFDTFLQYFLTDYPEYIEQPLIISTVSYGGFLAAYIAELVTTRNQQDTSGSRINKKIDQILLGNAFADVGADLRWRHQTNCVDQPAIYDNATCAILDYAYPKSQAECQDALLWADTEKTTAARTTAWEACVGEAGDWTGSAIANPYNRLKPPCDDLAGTCFWWYPGLSNYLNSNESKALLNVRNPDTFFWYVNSSALNFYLTHDNMQNSPYKLFESSLNAGTRLLVMSGDADTVCPWRGSYSWMSRLYNPHLEDFRASNWTSFAPGIPAEGEVISPGSDFTLLKVFNASHFVSEQNPELVQHIIAAAVDGYNYDPTQAPSKR